MGNLLMDLASWSAVQNDVSVVRRHNTLFLTCDHLISLNQRRNSFKRDTCIFCKVENLIPIINHM